MVRMACTATPLDSEVFTARELRVPLVLLDLVLSKLWPLDSQDHQAMLAQPPQGQVPHAAALLQPPGLKLKKDSANK